MTEQELKRLTKGREKRTLEYKTAWSELPDNLFETICAFLNRDGGVIVLGALDDGSIIDGVNPKAANQMCKNIANMSNNKEKLNPQFLLQPEIVPVDDGLTGPKEVIVVQVPSSSQVHQTAKKIFDRSVDGDYEVRTDAERSAMYLRKSTQYSENRIYPYLKREHLSEETIQKAKNLIRDNDSSHPWLGLEEMAFFRLANLYREDISTGECGFTLAALMLFGQKEVIQSALPYYRIDAILRLKDTNRYDDHIYLDGNIIEAYDQLMAFIRQYMPDKFYQEPDGRRVSLRDKVFREVVANLLIHREYLNPTPTEVVIGIDGVVSVNANRPLKAGPVTLENYVRHPKNPHMANFFVQLGHAEHLGTGVKNIFHYTKLYSGREPQLDDEDSYKVTISLPPEMEPLVRETKAYKEVQKKVQKRRLNVTERQMKVLARMVADPSVTKAQIAGSLSASVKNVSDDISALKVLCILRREGGRKDGKWIVLLD